MFGKSKPVVFHAYGQRRSSWRLPRWLVLLLTGTALGVAAVVGVQERLLPPRLSVGESAALRSAFDTADAERQQLRSSLAQTQQRLATAEAAHKAQVDELASARVGLTRLREDLAAVVTALPPDPRGGTVAVRAGRFSVKGNQLSYDLVLTRDRASSKPLPSTLRLLVAGANDRGVPTTAPAKTQLLQLGSHEVVRGSMPLPPGFKPQQTTVQLLDPNAGTAQGMRVLQVR
jgi:hypothetical protein